MNKGKITLIALGVIVVVLIVVFFMLVPTKTEAPTNDAVNTATTTEQIREIVLNEDGVPSIEGGVVEIIDETEVSSAQPSLDRPITIPDTFPQEAAQLMATKIADAIAAVEQDPTLYGNWLTLGNLRGQIQDHEGAEEVYVYLTETSPDNAVGYTNLGNTYHYHLPDYPKAEANYLAAIERSPGNENAYSELHTLYKNVYKTDTTAAVDILLRGLEQKPQSINFRLQLAKYYEDTGDVENQLRYLEEALDEANRTNNTTLAESLTAEIEALK